MSPFSKVFSLYIEKNSFHKRKLPCFRRSPRSVRILPYLVDEDPRLTDSCHSLTAKSKAQDRDEYPQDSSVSRDLWEAVE